MSNRGQAGLILSRHGASRRHDRGTLKSRPFNYTRTLPNKTLKLPWNSFNRVICWIGVNTKGRGYKALNRGPNEKIVFCVIFKGKALFLKYSLFFSLYHKRLSEPVQLIFLNTLRSVRCWFSSWVTGINGFEIKSKPFLMTD